ncbi:MAG: hypothetical protein QNJ23_12410 [Woeseiaceae bacterium]|nr:hypothetical protein [Woeseiaceae bacterium]
MKTVQALLMFALAAPAVALSQDTGKYQCTHGDLVRRVEIFTEPGVTVPCEVHYFKDTEAPGESEVLWSAQAQEGYCEQKAAEFIAKLEGWGWDCGAAAEPAMPAEPDEPAEPEVVDDTDVLSPAEPDG